MLFLEETADLGAEEERQLQRALERLAKEIMAVFLLQVPVEVEVALLEMEQMALLEAPAQAAMVEMELPRLSLVLL